MSSTQPTNNNFLSKTLKRSKQVSKACGAIAGGLRAAYKIDAFKEPPRDILPKYLQTFCRKIGESFGVKVFEVEPVPQNHALWVSNHISWVDVAVIGTVSRAFFVAKAEIEHWPIFGALARAGGTLFIQRGSGDANSISDQIAEFMMQGSSVVFCPEATTTNGHKIKKLHGKLLRAAIKTGLPIQPMVICYANKDGTICEEVAYYGDMTMQQSIKRVLDCQDITAYVLPLAAISTTGKTQDELTTILHEQMQAGLSRLQQQVLSVKPADAIWD